MIKTFLSIYLLSTLQLSTECTQSQVKFENEALESERGKILTSPQRNK